MGRFVRCHLCGIGTEKPAVCNIYYRTAFNGEISFSDILLCSSCANRIYPMFDAIRREFAQPYDMEELIRENAALKNRIYELENKDKEEQLE